MSVPAPHYLLFSEAAPASDYGEGAGRWRFVLRAAAGPKVLDAADEEPEAAPDRLELLAIVRGLESLDRPARVTLVTARRSIQHGLKSGLPVWRENDWQWERYGKLAPVKNADLWRRIERLAGIHTVECRCSRPKPADDLNPPVAAPAWAPGLTAAPTRRLRVDLPHAAAGSTKHQAPSTKQIPRHEIQMTERRFGQPNLGAWCLFAIWCLLIGAVNSARRAFDALALFRQHTT